jgi:hypothetical protein
MIGESKPSNRSWYIFMSYTRGEQIWTIRLTELSIERLLLAIDVYATHVIVYLQNCMLPLMSTPSLLSTLKDRSIVFQNPASRRSVRVRGDQVFVARLLATYVVRGLLSQRQLLLRHQRPLHWHGWCCTLCDHVLSFFEILLEFLVLVVMLYVICLSCVDATCSCTQ